jgi:cytochrome P450
VSTSVEAADLAELAGRAERFFALDPEMLADPWTLYADLRERAPLLRVGPVVVVSRYDDIKMIFRDTERFSNRRQTGSRVTRKRAGLSGDELAMYDHLIGHDSHHLGLNDQPNHTRLRRFVAQAFSARAVNTLRGEAEQIAEELLDRIEAEGSDPFDLGDFSFYLPFRVVCRMLRIPDVDVESFRGWALAARRGLGTNYENLAEAYDAVRSIEAYVHEVIRSRRPGSAGEEPGDDLVSNLLAKGEDGSGLSDAELTTMFTVMLTSGNANDMISNAVIALDAWPEQRTLLNQRPELLKNAIEELFRYCPSAHGVHRAVAVDTEIDGFGVEAGETLRLLVASANHDPARFTDPARLDLEREDAKHHLDLGFGIHTCLGQWLARLDIEVGLGALYRRYPELRVAGEFDYRPEYNFRGPVRLLVSPR